MRTDKRASQKPDKKAPSRVNKRGVVGYSKKSALLEEAISHMNTGKYGRSSAALKELLALDPQNTEARRLFATLHLRLGSLVTARQAFESLANEAIERQDYWLAESLLQEYLAAGPRCVPFLELLAHVYREKGDEMAAVGELGKAIEILRDDPDAENPQRAAQLYAKIRELAPGSPVAIQLASLFDVQTGEFLIRPQTVEHPESLHDATTMAQDDSTSIKAETSLSEVMPWEESEESSPDAQEDPSSGAAPIEQAEFRIAEELPTQNAVREDEPAADVQEFSILSPALTSQGLDQTDSKVEPAYLKEEAADQDPPQDHSESATGTGDSLPSPMPWEQVSDASVQIPESELQSSPSLQPILSSSENVELPPVAPFSPMPALEQATGPAPLSASTEPLSAGGSVALSSPMPWEQVSDSSIQVQEMESSPEQTPTASAESTLSDFRKDLENPLSSLSSEALPAQTADTILTTFALDRASSVEEPPASVAPPEQDAPFQPTTEVPRSSSFSWTSVFDSAWKFAAGSTAPSPSAPSEIAPEVLTEAQHTEVVYEPEATTTSSVSVESEALLTDDSLPATESTSSDEVSLSSGQPNQVAAESLTSRQEVQVAENSVTTSAVPDSTPSYPVPAESRTADLPEFLAHSSADEATQLSVSPAMPASFSTVVDAQDIPEAEPVTVELSESRVPVETASPDPSPVALTQSTAQVEEPPQAVGGAETVTQVPSKPEPPAQSVEVTSHWNTGEVAVQLHRPTAKKKKWEKDSAEAPGIPATPDPAFNTLSEKLSEAIREWESTPVETAPPSISEPVAAPQPDTRPEWMQASEQITFSRPHVAPREEWQNSSSDSLSRPLEPVSAPTVASSAVDVLFSSTERGNYSQTQERLLSLKPRPRLVARLHRIRIGVQSFVGSCFSTTRSLTFLALAIAATTGIVAALGAGALGLAWIVMEEPPSALYQNLTITPPRTITDPKKNGYLLLLGFEAPSGQDPVQFGYEQKAGGQDVAASQVCMGGDDAKEGSASGGATGHVVKGWFRSANPMAQLKGQGDTIKALAAREASSLARYRQWLTMPFDDWGYGQLLSPNCDHLLLAHRLFLLEGFAQDSATGLDRLETDMQAWRTALGQSKTLMMKMLAVAAVQDDAAMASGLLSRSELDGTSVTRLSKMVRPLDQVELSVRWPMQSHFVWATKAVSAELKHDQANDRPWHVSLVAGMRLPIQRRANAYAEYYEATNKAVAEGRYMNLPKPSGFLRTPATGLMDYLANPVEHIVGIEPLLPWDPYVMRMMETDAQLRLVGLQAWIRRGPQDGELLTRLAKAGQAYYDPFTGLPMLVNQRKGLIYSVGRDGKDQEGDRTNDVAVAIPSVPSSLSEGKRSTTPSPSR